MRAFNCFQFTSLLCAMPFIINWLHSGPFEYAGIAKWVACLGYLVIFVMNCVMVYESSDKL